MGRLLFLPLAYLISYFGTSLRFDLDNADILFEKAKTQFKNNKFFLVSYANHLIRKRQWLEAKRQCESALRIDKFYLGANSTYVEVLCRADSKAFALEWIESTLAALPTTAKNDLKSLKFELHKSAYEILDYWNFLRSTFFDIISILRYFGKFSVNSISVRENVSQNQVGDTIRYWERALSLLPPDANEKLFLYPAKNIPFLNAYCYYLIYPIPSPR